MAEDTGNGANTTGTGGEGSGEGSTTAITQAAYDALAAENTTLKETAKHATTQAVTRKAKNKALEGEIASLRKATADGTTDEGEKGKQFQVIFDKLTNDKAALNDELRDIKVYGSVRSIAHKLGANRPDDVVTLLKGRISFDDAGNTIIDGGKLNDKTGKAFSLDELTTSFLAERQDMVKPSGNSGAGSTNSAGGARGNGKTFTAKQIGEMSQDQYEQARKDNGGLPPI